ncbi:YrhB domain-containing protein [Catenuloplanes sp. NPDC051500]|uniref:YrhB domain-containing protein n=1 Tax=Catenuloplanes sp. NPDC051500 TaxID=3363959 RepID=UPI0037920914
MIDIHQARALAEAKVREIEEPATPLVLTAPDAPREYPWAWAFSYNAARYLETNHFSDMVPAGPIIVLKDGSDVWIANSAPPVEQWLNMYAEQHGLATLPLPRSFTF